MKTLSVIAIGVSLILMVLTSAPYSRSDTAGPEKHDGLFWANPDGSHGLIAGPRDQSSFERRGHVWVNPDGVSGTDDSLVGPSSARDYSWVNPDGSTGHPSPAHANASRSDVAF